MSVKISLHPFLTHLTDDKDVHEVDGKTVGECLEQIAQRYPGVREWILDKDGKLNNIFEVYVNMESAYPEGLAKAVGSGDEIHVVIVIAGG